MTDEKLDMLLQKSLQSTEKAPEFHLVRKKTPVHRWVSGLAAMCACALVCVGAYVASHKQYSDAAAVVTTETATEKISNGSSKHSAMTESAVAAPAEPASGICGYPTFADMEARKWMEENAPNAPYACLAESEKYCSYLCIPAEGERLYLVLEKATGEPMSLEDLLERNGFAGNREDVNMLYVNEVQDLIWVRGTEEVNLGYVE